MTKTHIEGTQTPKEKQGILSKEEIMFKTDDDGIAIPEEIEIEVYDRVLDDEILLTTFELDNCLTLYESNEKSREQLKKGHMFEIDKLIRRIRELSEVKELTSEQKKLMEETKKDLKVREDTLNKLILEIDTKLIAFKSKANECRKDLEKLEKMVEDQKAIRNIEARPCFVADAHRYFTKKMYKDKKGDWISPKDKEDTTYISHLLAEHVSNPKLTVDEWDKAKPDMRLACKDGIADISYYQKRSPRELLLEGRRSENLKNIIGE